MELLIYVAVFAVAAGLLTGITTTILKVGSRESSLVETTGQLNFVMQTISRLTRESSAIIVNATSTDVSNDDQIGSPFSRLVLRMEDSAGGVSDRDPIIIWNDSGVIKMSEGSGTNQKTSDLTNTLVVVDKLKFTKFTQYPGHDSVAIDIQLTYNSQNPESRISRSLRTAIARVSAATFDSNLLPGSVDFEIGQQGAPWKNLYISGNVGIGTTSPGAKLHIGGTAGVDGIKFPDGTLQTTASGGVVTLGNQTAGGYLLIENTTARTISAGSYTKYKETKIGVSGTLRITLGIHSGSGGGTTYGRIYRNGVAVGIEHSSSSGSYILYSEDITGWSVGDLVQGYAKHSGATNPYISNLNIYTAAPPIGGALFNY